MRKLVSAAILAGSFVVLAYGNHKFNSKFDNNKVWERQRPAIERIQGQEIRDSYYNTLRTILKKHENSSRKEKCMHEKRFEAILQKGSEEAADSEIARRSYDPHEECNTLPQLKEEIKTWNGLFGIAGLGGILVGLWGLALSVRDWYRIRATRAALTTKEKEDHFQ